LDSEDRGGPSFPPSLSRVLYALEGGGHSNGKDVELANDSNLTLSLGSQNDGSSSSTSYALGRDPYLLRPRSHIQVVSSSRGMGLGNVKYPWPPKVGQNLTLKHAQEQASRDVSLDRQRLIYGALRVGASPSPTHP